MRRGEALGQRARGITAGGGKRAKLVRLAGRGFRMTHDEEAHEPTLEARDFAQDGDHLDVLVGEVLEHHTLDSGCFVRAKLLADFVDRAGDRRRIPAGELAEAAEAVAVSASSRPTTQPVIIE